MCPHSHGGKFLGPLAWRRSAAKNPAQRSMLRRGWGCSRDLSCRWAGADVPVRGACAVCRSLASLRGECPHEHQLTDPTVSFLLQTHSGYFSSLYPPHQFGPFPHHHSVSVPPGPPPLPVFPCPVVGAARALAD